MASLPPRFSSLRNRFLAALALVVGVAALVLALIARYQITPILLEDESRYASGELDRIERALDNERDHLQSLVEDWAWWDDTYAFVSGTRPEYVDSNLYAGTLETLGVELMAFFAADGSPYWTAGIDRQGAFWSCAGQPDTCGGSRELTDLIRTLTAGELEARTHSWLLANDSPALIALSPILKSQDDSPANGWLAMVLPLSEPLIAQLRETTGIDLSLDGQPVEGSMADDRLQRLSPTRMRVIRDLAALPGGQALRLEAILPRQRYQASLETFRFALIWTAAVLAVTLVVVLLLLERMILRPLRDFARFTQQLSRHEHDQQTPDALIGRKDEIGILARAFQHLRQRQRHQHDLLLEMSQHDALTGLANRRLLDEHLAAALARAAQGEHGVTLMMVDIDHFKAYNDHFGHPAGDACLRTIAETMCQHFNRAGQLVARTGGEEFTVVLPGAPPAAGPRMAESLRAAIEHLAIPHPHSRVTISIGVSQLGPRQQRTAESLIAGADTALYAAKRAGRNRVRVESALHWV
ncbi:sensor domain-containing diguanylate cyclase [Halomonas nitroreducens]|uniref:diguanylate cyclase n=1 Tax=Halomonas nitroreducens TaxID=447425 RepID=A0A3S0R3U7_9GAMM|nr:diguanylate cyclase [Halomonas nitroreducens]RTR06423.1 diguanylate cyclase [Halomonas nitroreducens]